jgi:hypothetical protein
MIWSLPNGFMLRYAVDIEMREKQAGFSTKIFGLVARGADIAFEKLRDGESSPFSQPIKTSRDIAISTCSAIVGYQVQYECPIIINEDRTERGA